MTIRRPEDFHDYSYHALPRMACVLVRMAYEFRSAVWGL